MKKGNRASEPDYLGIKGLNRFAKAWEYFICTNISPNVRPHQVNHERLALLDCITHGRSFDVGRIIHDRMVFCASRSTSVLLGHGGLITAMCIKAGLRLSAAEPRLPLGNPLTADYIMGLAQWPHGEAHPDGCGFINVPDRFLNPEDPYTMEFEDEQDPDYNSAATDSGNGGDEATYSQDRRGRDEPSRAYDQSYDDMLNMMTRLNSNYTDLRRDYQSLDQNYETVRHD